MWIKNEKHKNTNLVLPSDNCNFFRWHIIIHRLSGHVFTASLEADDIILRDNATPYNPLASRVLIDVEGYSKLVHIYRSA